MGLVPQLGHIITDLYILLLCAVLRVLVFLSSLLLPHGHKVAAVALHITYSLHHPKWEGRRARAKGCLFKRLNIFIWKDLLWQIVTAALVSSSPCVLALDFVVPSHSDLHHGTRPGQWDISRCDTKGSLNWACEIGLAHSRVSAITMRPRPG